MKRILGMLLVSGLLYLAGCNRDSAVRVENKEGRELYVCDLTKVKDSLVLPLSELVEMLHIVKLDTAQEALLGSVAHTTITDHYIGVACFQRPFKLFTKDGKFLRNIGAVGKGPGEYLNIYCAQIDEANDVVYLLPWQSKQLLRYTLAGEALEPVPLFEFMPKGTFRVRDGKIFGMALPLPGIPAIAYSQDLEGNLLDTVPVGPYVEKENWYSNEISSRFNTENNDLFVFRWVHRDDSLYYYEGTGRLIPRFTVDFPEGSKSLYELGEWPRHFWVLTMEMIQAERGMTTGNFKNVLIDKNQKKASYFRIEDDLLMEGDKIEVYYFQNRMFLQNLPAVKLIEGLEKILKREGLKPELKERAEQLLNGLQEDDNNVIVWGRMKD